MGINNNFLLNSLFYDSDDIISFFDGKNIIKENFDFEINKNIDNFDLIEKVSNKLENIILKSNISCKNNKRALKSIFTTFKKHSVDNEIKYYPLSLLNKNTLIYPNEIHSENLVCEKYVNNLEYLEKITDSNNINFILNRLSTLFSYIPYYKEGNYNLVGDISFYDKLKINTALSSCLYLLLNEKENDSPFALLSGDISGIQKFIYTISSKGALKSLRARSFYLEIMLEHIVDEILCYFKLERCNLLYTGGGHFYIILPNLKNLKDDIYSIKDRINNWFIEEFSIDLYIAMDYESFSFKDLENIKNIFKELSKKLSFDKQNRYNKEQLKILLFPKENESYYEECSICNTSSKSAKKREEDLGYVCNTCYNLYKAGKHIINENDDITITNTKNNLEKIINLPSLQENRYLYFGSINKNNSVVRIYSKNNSNEKHINLYLGNYNYKKDNKNEDLISFEDLIECTNGIKRIGVLICDVDNLGQAFINGFEDHSDIFKTSALSRHLSLFFKFYINLICEGNVQFDNNKLFCDKYYNKEKRIVIVYSGGDDVFLVGYWLDVIDFAFDLRESFRIYTNDKLTFSAGIGFFHSSYPISKMAHQTGKLEDLAKNNKDKDSIALFGIPHNFSETVDEYRYCFNWKEFDKVRDKIKIIFNTCYFDEASANEDKVFLSISFIYRLKQLMEFENLEDYKINITRLAYSLSKIKSNENNTKNYDCFKNNIYKWFLDNKEIKYLNTALDLIVYLKRDDSNK